ncbi:hypothetical protein DFP72DRAFT_1110652 [Ephemerocybe angulata]|uniref:Uncharacterized protein n=1 Tax=Ephemerocybe angulata TaxID=980116 RepID=A0A8H6I2P0_9AGAR|nr:hypothetical protein DFP72DRAFT_1110652 [Tulosesus angulatus]
MHGLPPYIWQSISAPQAPHEPTPSPLHTPLLSFPSAQSHHDNASTPSHPCTIQRLCTLPLSSSLQLVPQFPTHSNTSLGPTFSFSYPSAPVPPSYYIPAPAMPQHSRALYDSIPLPHLATQVPYTLHPLLTTPLNSSQMIIWDVRTSPYAADAHPSGSQVQIHSGPPLAAPWLLESAASPTQASLTIRIDNSECSTHRNVFTVYSSSQTIGTAYVTVLDVLLCVSRAGASRPRRRCACNVSARIHSPPPATLSGLTIGMVGAANFFAYRVEVPYLAAPHFVAHSEMGWEARAQGRLGCGAGYARIRSRVAFGGLSSRRIDMRF